jgi:CDGSH-type Zn-finger protein
LNKLAVWLVLQIKKMEKPKVAAKEPTLIDLEEGKNYAWCSCGKSVNQPWCSGAHKGTNFTPHIFRAEKAVTEAICQCKHTKTPPFCDGSHMEFL